MSDPTSSPSARLQAEARKSLKESLAYLHAMTSLVGADTSACLTHVAEARERFDVVRARPAFEELQFWLRALIRAFFAEVEVTTFTLRRVLLWASERGELALGPSEIAVLREEAYTFDSAKQRIRSRPAFNRLVDNVVLTFTILPRIGNETDGEYFREAGWAAFQRAVKIRDSVTHPKTPEEFILGVEDARACREAVVWFHGTLKALYRHFLVASRSS